MAGEQEKDQEKELKPKAKLIKHRRDDSPSELPEAQESAGAGHIKVVKKKMVVKVKNHSDGKESNEKGSSANEGNYNPPSSRAPSGNSYRNESASGQSNASSNAANDGNKQRNYSTKQGVVGGRYVGPPRRENTEHYERRPYDRSNNADRPGNDRPNYERRYDRSGPGSGADSGAPSYDRSRGQSPNPGRYSDNRNTGRFQDRGAPGQRYGNGGDREGGGQNRGPRPPYSGPNRNSSGGPGGANRGPGGNRPSSFQGGRPGGFAGKNGPSRDASPAPDASDRTQSAKKFVKAKKGKDAYQKKDRLQEKELQFNKKKAIVKANPIPKTIDIMEVITVSELARKMNLKASDLIAKLFGMGMMVTINQQIDADTASILAAEYDCKVNIVSLYDETIIESEESDADNIKPRAPVVTIMGHVDHGKTKLLDAIRSTHVVDSEDGGITQHIGAYQVETPRGKITFIDTPGHEAFTAMRARGAQVTDIVILVVAANDGVMPQTVEAIRHAQDGKVPIVVAVNKVDLPDANIDRVKQQLSEYNLLSEDWGGTTQYFPISALKKEGLDELLDGLLLQAEMLELKADDACRAEGRIIESKIDQGRGIVATVLIQRGMLRIGSSFVAGVFPGKVRAMFNDRGDRIEEAGPSSPVEILGFTGVPDSGDPFQVTESDKDAREFGEKRQELKKIEEAKNVKKITLDNLYDSIQEGESKELNVIIKGDVHGSVEAIQASLEKLSTREIKLSVKLASAGAINESDVLLAAASGAIIIGFHVRPSPKAQLMADQEKVEIRKYSIIYDVIEDIKAAMEGLLSPELKEEALGTVEVREVFKVPKLGLIAGAYVQKGSVKRNAQVHIVRDGIEIYTGTIISLRRFKDDAKQVDAGYECGVGVEGFTDIQIGDIFEIFEMKEVAKKLGKTLVEEQEELKKQKKE